jgi:hypothetical protein
MKIIAFDEIYNFVVQNFSIWSHLHSQIIDNYPDLSLQSSDLNSVSIIWVWRWLQMEKLWTRKL